MTKLRLKDQHPDLQAAVNDPTVAVIYRPGSRDYIVPKIMPHNIPRRVRFKGTLLKGPKGYSFQSCPFSGELLPGDVGEIRTNRILKQTGLEFWDLYFDTRRIPKWATTEDWWVNEGIGLNYDEEILALMTGPPKWPYEMNTPWPGHEDRELPGYRASLDEPEHYCYGLSEIFSREYMFGYLPYTREYGPRIIDPNKRVDYQPIRILPVLYCPWCGTRLPESKRPEWEQRVRDAGFDPANPEAEGFPKELLRDAWWRNAAQK